MTRAQKALGTPQGELKVHLCCHHSYVVLGLGLKVKQDFRKILLSKVVAAALQLLLDSAPKLACGLLWQLLLDSEVCGGHATLS